MKNFLYDIGSKTAKKSALNVEFDLLRSSEGDNATVAALPFYYSDEMFLNSACGYNHKLCILSLGLTMTTCAVGSEGDEHVRKALIGMGFNESSIESRKFDKTKPINDSCAYAFAVKKLAGTDQKLLTVVIRSHRYGGEWVSNAHVFSDKYPGYAAGFKSAADKVYSALRKYISEQKLDKSKLKIWVAGFSRGGAISNNLGHLLNSGLGIKKDNIFVYTFAAPNTVEDKNWVYYDNIFNVLSEMDVVPRVPLRSWGFRRFGTDLRLPCESRRGTECYTERLDAMRERFAEIMQAIDTPDNTYEPYKEQEKVLDMLIAYSDKLFPSPDKYAQDGYQSFIMDYMSGKIYGSAVDMRRFIRFLVDGDEEFAEELCGMLEQWDSMGAMQKAQRIGGLNLKITSMLKKHLSGDKAPALEMLSLGLGVLAHYAARLTADKVTKSGQDNYYELLIRLAVDAYHVSEHSPVLMQHWPEVYLAWLLSGDEKTLYRTDGYRRLTIK